MAKHLVTVTVYSLATNHVGEDIGEIYRSEHSSARSAAKRLAMLISGKTVNAHTLEISGKLRAIRASEGAVACRYLVDGTALVPFRKAHGISTKRHIKLMRGMAGTYMRLNVLVSASGIEVMRAARRKLAQKAFGAEQAESRMRFYHTMLKHHRDAQKLARQFRL